MHALSQTNNHEIAYDFEGKNLICIKLASLELNR